MGKKVYIALLMVSSVYTSTFGLGLPPEPVDKAAFDSDYVSNNKHVKSKAAVSGVSANHCIACATRIEDEVPGFWLISASMGYAHYKDVFSHDSNAFVGRAAIGINPIHLAWRKLAIGLEAGIQSGNSMHINVSQEDLNKMGGGPYSSTMKPMVDLLGTLRVSLNESDTLSFILKGGAACRQWTFESDEISSKTQISPELQVGLGVNITPRIKLVAYYQGVYSGNANLTVKAMSEYKDDGSVQNTPTQHGGFLGVEIAL
jgi:hypothetical protein